MAQFDNWPMFQNFSFQEFHFPVDRYEEWEAGRIVAHPTNPVEGCADANPKTELPNDT